MAVIDFYDYTSPSCLLTGNNYNLVPAPMVLRTDMDSGPSKQRPKASTNYFQHSVTYLFTNADYYGFLDWYVNTAGNGAATFNWVDPFDKTDGDDGTTKDARIVNGQITQASPMSAAATAWAVQFVIEVASNAGAL